MNQETKTCPYCFEEIKAEATKCRWCRSTLVPENPPAIWWRNHPGRRFLGVASALAANTGINVLAWRVLFILLTFFHGIGLLTYLAIWALTPFRRGGRSPIERVVSSTRQAVHDIRTDELGGGQAG